MNEELPAFVLAAAVYGYRIRVEEREMEENFGDSYRAYERQTWRISCWKEIRASVG